MNSSLRILRDVRLLGVLFALSTILLIGFHALLWGWGVLSVTAAISALSLPAQRDQFLALCVAIAIIALTPVNTNLATEHIVVMLVGMVAAVAVPYLFLERWRHYGVIKYKLHHGRRWYRTEMLYVLFPAALGYFILPFYFRETHQYLNWHVTLGWRGLILLFIGLVAVGIWDEVIFVATIANVLRKHLPFWIANALQAVVFSSFLYELGFRNWAVLCSYIFALVQCYIFKITNSLIYAITIHVIFDVMLFLALIHAYYPHLLRIFITG